MTTENGAGLELGDIQAGALMPRPNPYAGAYLALRIDDRRAGRELLRRLIPLLGPVASFDPARPVSLAVALSFAGLKALGVPEESLATFPAEFQQGMAARAAYIGDVGDGAPENWEAPLGSKDVHLVVAVLAPDTALMETLVSAGRRRRPRPARRRPRLASGRARARGRPRAVRLQGQHRPAGRRGYRHPRQQPARSAAQGRRVRPGVRRRDRRAWPRCRSRRCWAATARTWSSASCTSGWPPSAGTCTSSAADDAEQDVAGGQAGRALAQRRAAGPGPGQGRPGAGRRPGAQQRLHVRR